MSERITHLVEEMGLTDRSGFNQGEWDDEPADKRKWIDAETGFVCVMKRVDRMGHWCGYVGIPESHHLHGIGYDLCTNIIPCREHFCDHSADLLMEVHGGITYSGDYDFYSDTRGELWWFGFDCAHAWDVQPYQRPIAPGAEYRTQDFVESEVLDLATQLAEFTPADAEGEA